MIVNTSVPRDRLTYLADHGHPHLKSIVLAVRDHGVSLCWVPQGKMPFEPMHDRPAIVLIGDDMQEAKGPDAFHHRSLVRFVKRCHAAAIVSCEALPAAYTYIAAAAAYLRKDAILVETRPEHEADWKNELDKTNQRLSFLIATVEPMGGVQ